MRLFLISNTMYSRDYKHCFLKLIIYYFTRHRYVLLNTLTQIRHGGSDGG